MRKYSREAANFTKVKFTINFIATVKFEHKKLDKIINLDVLKQALKFISAHKEIIPQDNDRSFIEILSEFLKKPFHTFFIT